MDGMDLDPSLFGMIVGRPFSKTATELCDVPRSMPTILPNGSLQVVIILGLWKATGGFPLKCARGYWLMPRLQSWTKPP